ncbi:MAG: hypothetical protein ABIO43_05590 [Sphingomicrobium sp.]
MGLAAELIVSAILLVIVTIIHGTGLSLMDRLFRTEVRELADLKLVQREFGVMVPMALCLMTLHIVEIFLFAAFYLATEDASSVRDAIYHSAMAYTTMGVVEGGISKWTIVFVFEGLAGFLMIGWSSAVFVTDMERVLRRRR